MIRRVVFLWMLLSVPLAAAGPEPVVIDFEDAPITGRWVDSWEEKGVRFTPAHPPTRSRARARLMFFPHLSSGQKGLVSAMADDPIPVRAQFPDGATSVTVTFWGSTGCAARLEAFDRDGRLVDVAGVDAVPGRQAPGDPIPLFELTVTGTAIDHIQFSGPRAGEYLAAASVVFVLESQAKLEGDESVGKPDDPR